jgi:hypothetical protein
MALAHLASNISDDTIRRRLGCSGFHSHLYSLVVTMNPKSSATQSHQVDPRALTSDTVTLPFLALMRSIGCPAFLGTSVIDLRAAVDDRTEHFGELFSASDEDQFDFLEFGRPSREKRHIEGRFSWTALVRRRRASPDRSCHEC